MDKKHIIYQIKSLNQSIVRYAFSEKNIDKKNIPTPTQMQIMHYIKFHDGKVYQKDLEKALNIRRATISEVLKTMEKNNLISRLQDKTDTRVKVIKLNKKAHQMFDEMKQVLDKTENVLKESIKEQDLETFLLVLNQMKINLKKEREKIC